MPDQEQPDEIEKCLLFDLIDLKSFKPQGNSIEQFLIADTNSYQGGIYGTYVTTHRISARTLAQVQKVCRRFSDVHPPFLNEVMRNLLQEPRRALKSVFRRGICRIVWIGQKELVLCAGGGDIE